MIKLELTQAQIDAISLALHIAINHTETRLEAVVPHGTQARLDMLTTRLHDFEILSRTIDDKAVQHQIANAPTYWA